MKKIITSFSVLCLLFGTTLSYAQNERNAAISADNETSMSQTIVVKGDLPTVLGNSEPFYPMSMMFDNGPLVNFPGQGSGGADVSAMHDGLITYGFGQSVASGTRCADDFVVPAGQNWAIDSIVFFGYQTGSTTASTFNAFHLAVRNVSPLTDPSPNGIIWGDTTTDVLDASYWSGIYRATSATLTATSRPIMKNRALTAGLSLAAGTYFLDWQAGGTLASGPWNPPVTQSVTITGDAMQLNAGAWVSLIDTAQAGTSDDAAQGLPFIIYGNNNNGVHELYNNGNVQVFPNPVFSSATVEINDNVKKSSQGFSFVIYDAIGSLVRKTDGINSNSFTVKKDNLPTGAYIYEVRNGNEVIKRGKLSVQD